MRIVFIGGTGMTGPYAVRDLLAAGHEVWLIHRTPCDLPVIAGATQLRGDKGDLSALRETLSALRLDVAVHMVARTEMDAIGFCAALAGIVRRTVVISSIDVYRACGRLHRTEPGEPDAVPLGEDAPLRSKLSIHGTDYDKLAVERIVTSQPKLPCTVLRYPGVYGPGDARHRLSDWVRRMDDGRAFILMGQDAARWRFTHGYVENVARALTLAVTDGRATGRIYNVGEAETPRWADWAREIGSAAGWSGRVVEMPDERLPAHLAAAIDFRQDWVVDTARIRAELGYSEPVSRAECLRRAIAWERANTAPRDPKEFNYAAEDAAVADFLGRV